MKIRAIACGITRMTFFGEMFAPACMNVLAMFNQKADRHSVFSHSELGGVATDDDIGMRTRT